MRYLIVITLLCSHAILYAQKLERKGSLGARLEPAADGRGIRVVEVLPNTTASGIGLLSGDVLLEVNAEATNSVVDLVDRIGSWRSGDPLTMLVQHRGNAVVLKGKVVGKPMETSEHGRVIYGEVPFDGGLLRSILELPRGVPRAPVVLMLPGVGCYSQDHYADPRSPFKQLVEGLVAQGIAVFRVEKPGMGDSRNTTPCPDMDFDHEVAAYRAALATLRGTTGIDVDHIYLMGHSMGVLTAPRIAEPGTVAGIIAWGGIATSWFEYELRLIREQEVIQGKDPVAQEKELRARLPLLTDFYVRKRTPEQLAADTACAAVLPLYLIDDRWHGLQHYTYFHDIADVDILSGYRNANCPVLTVAGALDLHAIDTTWAGDIAAAVNALRPGTARSVVVPNTTHHYFTVPSMADYVALEAAGKLDDAYMADHYNADVARTVGAWVLEQE